MEKLNHGGAVTIRWWLAKASAETKMHLGTVRIEKTPANAGRDGRGWAVLVAQARAFRSRGDG